MPSPLWICFFFRRTERRGRSVQGGVCIFKHVACGVGYAASQGEALDLRCTFSPFVPPLALNLDPFLSHRIPVALRPLSTREGYRQEEPQNKRVSDNPPIEYPPNRTLSFRASLDITESGLRAILAPYGPIDFLYILHSASGKSRGLGLVAFTEQKSADPALGADLFIPGVRLAYAVPANSPSLAVHISNLPPKSTQDELGAALAQYGEIVTCRIEERNKSNKRRGGHALVIFADQSAADTACKAGISTPPSIGDSDSIR
ncbi:hypothetical protein C8R43DRAFT_1203162 [Mycena crocata]|nr:hypothetical protein C8R43DRAFT_1203162 [Mycena crocata]